MVYILRENGEITSNYYRKSREQRSDIQINSQFDRICTGFEMRHKKLIVTTE